MANLEVCGDGAEEEEEEEEPVPFRWLELILGLGLELFGDGWSDRFGLRGC